MTNSAGNLEGKTRVFGAVGGLVAIGATVIIGAQAPTGLVANAGQNAASTTTPPSTPLIASAHPTVLATFYGKH